MRRQSSNTINPKAPSCLSSKSIRDARRTDCHGTIHEDLESPLSRHSSCNRQPHQTNLRRVEDIEGNAAGQIGVRLLSRSRDFLRWRCCSSVLTESGSSQPTGHLLQGEMEGQSRQQQAAQLMITHPLQEWQERCEETARSHDLDRSINGFSNCGGWTESESG